ncbi:MAG: DUF72 domain-containing protein [Deltaproteobacteria bacterium]|nr:DUF72 domain-containing protein [Deltaproteobacteria bacterium]
MDIKIGTSGYSYPGPPPKGWFGVFYPESKAKRFDALEYYANFFDTVEINTTFYRPPEPDMAEAWARKTPSDFEFAVKVWQKFTHATKIGEGEGERGDPWEAPTQADVDLFKKGVEPLEQSGKLGALLFQYPPGFHYTEENAEKLRWALAAFKDSPKVVEMRHNSWSDRAAATGKLLAESGASWALIDEPKFESSVRQEFEPAGSIFYLRLHGRNRAKWWRHAEAWERYDYLYSQKEVASIAQKLKSVARAQGERLGKAFVFFNNHARGQAVVNAIMLSHEMGTPVKSRPVDQLVSQFPQIAGLVPLSKQPPLL